MPYMTMPAASDPTSSWQVRLKGKTLYITARTGLYRIRLNNAGIRPGK